MIHKRFLDIDKNYIDSLISNKVYETKTLEYKSKLPGDTDSEKKEFLADISSFANASGGVIIFGISENKDINDNSRKILISSPIKGYSADKEKLRLEEIIRNGISPRLKIEIKEILGWDESNKDFIILIRIPKSFDSPHMVTLKGSSKFYSRTSAGKYELDVTEIRSEFLATESQADRITQFINDRLSKIVADETPLYLTSPFRLVLHIIPISSFLNKARFDLSIENHILNQYFHPVSSFTGDSRYNLDGYVNWSQKGYCQLYFNGVIESAISDIFNSKINSKRNYLESTVFEKSIIQSINNYFKGYLEVGVVPPFIISLAMFGCKDVFMDIGDRYVIDNSNKAIDRNNLILPNVRIDDINEDISKSMKPIFDSVWNACGYLYSFNYDKDGNWKIKLS